MVDGKPSNRVILSSRVKFKRCKNIKITEELKEHKELFARWSKLDADLEGYALKGYATSTFGGVP